jgi:hypothetical protein
MVMAVSPGGSTVRKRGKKAPGRPQAFFSSAIIPIDSTTKEKRRTFFELHEKKKAAPGRRERP